jgi:hypothetical protein
MLRITIHHSTSHVAFQLEGRLVGVWVKELEACWQATPTCQPESAPLVDLTGLTAIDAEGKACLAVLHRQGAKFVASDCLTKAIVAEITQGGFSNLACPHGDRESRSKGDRGAT